MLRQEGYLRILEVFNRAARAIDSKSQMGLEGLIDLVGPPEANTGERVLQTLLEHALKLPPPQASSTSRWEPLSLLPVGPSCYQTDAYGFRELPNPRFDADDRPMLIFDEEVYGSRLLTASPCRGEVTFSGEELFYEFLALNLTYTLRDGRLRYLKRATRDDYRAQERRWRQALSEIERVRSPTAAELAAWSAQRPLSLGEERQRRERWRVVSLNPSPQDKQKILGFLKTYGGPSFLPDDGRGQRSDELLVYDPATYFIAFNFAWQTFDECARRWLGQPPAPSPAREDSGGVLNNAVEHALETVKRIIEQVDLTLLRQVDGSIVPAVAPTCGLYCCYVTLVELAIFNQPGRKRCALPDCQLPFNPKRRDQSCCCSTHANRLRQRRHDHKSRR